MFPKQPPKKTPTRPGLGNSAGDNIPRLDSAEMQKVRESVDKAKETSPTPPPPSQRGARVPREDEDENGPVSVPRSDHFVSANRPKPQLPPQNLRQPQTVPQSNLRQPQTTPQSFKPSQTAPQPFKRTPTAQQAYRPMTPQSSKPIGPPKAQSAAKTTGAWGEESPTGQRTRKPVTIDAVGDAATRIARTTRQTSPKVIATPTTIASAPLDSRSAFVLSLVDGTSDVPAIVDASGLAEDEVIGILARLARLGLISVP